MLVTLKFKLPEEKSDFEMAIKAGLFYSAALGFRNILRNKIKYHENTPEQSEILEAIQKEFYEHFGDLLD